jgi:hypothetical protein
MVHDPRWCLLWILGLVLASCGEGANPAQCSDGVDNDNNGVADCHDEGCAEYCGDDDDDDDDATGDDDDCEGEDCDGDGYTVADGDCDDEDPAVFPGAEEICDLADNNCDGTVDEGFDFDGDGFPDGDDPDCAQNLPADQLDCNDADVTIHPDAAEECGDGVDNDCDGAIDENLDADGDGWATCDGDCDDDDPAVHPDADEVCNDLDDNCDGQADEGVPTYPYFPDGDGDGFGDPAGPVVEDCAEPPGHVGNQADCDDSDTGINPDAEEICNDDDENCNGVNDEGLPTDPYYPDLDGDDFGDADASPVQDCDQPPGFLADHTDCDDDDSAIYPGAAEIAGDGIDQDCDGADKPTYAFVSCGTDYTCGIAFDGTVWCFGRNDFSQAAPPQGQFQWVSAGTRHTCGERYNGDVECWGSNFNGESNVPPGGWDKPTAGGAHTCALSYPAQCWGDDSDGQASPPLLFNSAQISAGDLFTCALNSGDWAECWGDDTHGQLDAPNNLGSHYDALDAGAQHACGILSTTGGVCWGDDSYGQATATYQDLDVISAGGRHSCGVRWNGDVECWGDNSDGQLDAPTGAFMTVCAGGAHTCGIRPDLTMECWGDNSYGQLDAP